MESDGSEGRRLTHLDSRGRVAMVDVGGKPVVSREATAEGFVRLQPATVRMIEEDAVAKGNVLAVAHVAGVQAAKATSRLIPLCHQIALRKVGLSFELGEGGVRIAATVKTEDRTGVEMEALTAVSVAALTVYDMCKAVDSQMTIGPVRLVEKKKGGAKSTG